MARTDNVQINLNINGSRAISELNLLQSEAGKLRESIKQARKAGQDFSGFEKDLNKVTEAIKSQQNQLGLNGMTIAQLTYKKNQLTAEIRKNLVPATDEYIKKTAELQRVNARLSQLRQDVQGVASVWDQLKSKFAVTFDVGNMLARGFDTLTSSLKNAVGIAGTISDKFADIQKSTGLSGKEVGIFANSLQQLDSRTSFEGLLDIAKVGGQFGIANRDLLAFTETIDKVNVALGDELKGGTEEVTKVLGGLRNIFTDIKTKNVGNDLLHIGNAINQLGAEGAATGDVIADFAGRIGGVGITMGLTSGQVLGISATLQELNVTAERGATAFTRILQEMAQAPDVFAQVAGKSSEEFKKLVNTNIYEAFKLVAQGASASSSQATVFAQVLKKLDVDGAGASEVIAKLGSNVGLMETRVNSGSSAVKGINSVLGEFDVKNQTLQASMDKFGKLLYNVGYVIGDLFGKAFMTVSENIENFVSWMRKVPEVTNPAIEAARREKAELEILIKAIKHGNTSNKARIQLVEELRKKYPELSQKVGEFTDKTGELTVNERLLSQSVKDTNAEYDRRIFILSKQEIESQYQTQLAASIRKEVELRKSIEYQIKNFGEYVKTTKELASGATVEYTAPNKNLVNDRAQAEREVKSRENLLKERDETVKQLENIAKRQGLNISKIESDNAENNKAQQMQNNAFSIQTESELHKKQQELAKEAEDRKKEARQKSLEADKAYEDLRISLIKDAFDREIAETELATSRKVEESKKEFAFIKTNAQFNQAELAVKTKEHNDYLALLEQQKNEKIAGIEKQRAEEKRRQAEEERAQTISDLNKYLDEDLAREQASIEAKHQQKLIQINEQYALEDEQMWARVEALRVAEEEARAAELEAQRAHLQAKLFEEKVFGDEQSANYKKLMAELLGIDLEKQTKELENTRRTKELKKKLEQEGLDVARGALQVGIDLLNQDEEAKKKHSTLIKALTIADIQVGLQREVQGIWENANKNAINGVIPLWGQIFGGIQTGIAIMRAYGAIRKVSATQYEKGGIFKAVKRYALGGMIKNNGVLPSSTTHAQGGLHVVDSRSGRKVAEFEGQEGMIFSKAAIRNNPHLWQPLLYSSQYMGGAPTALPAARKYQQGGTFGTTQPATLSTLPTSAIDTDTANALMGKIDMLIEKIDSKSDAFKKTYLSYFELEEFIEQTRRRRAENSSV